MVSRVAQLFLVSRMELFKAILSSLYSLEETKAESIWYFIVGFLVDLCGLLTGLNKVFGFSIASKLSILCSGI